ncbi:WbqC family protein [Candidatus Pelagibacter sp.]|jgi:hypothetical protein|nr:WbqC family protein [Candidatus Pelagibacter sp.]
MVKKIVILQSNYIPWKGYFDIMNMADEFIFYDEAQYTKNDWRNRNKILTRNGIQWLTLPVRQKKLSQLIKDTKIEDRRWAKKHWESLRQNYSKAKYFKKYKEIFEMIYINCNEEFLSEINYKFINAINKILGIKTIMRSSSEFNKTTAGPSERLLEICKECDADIYLSGPSARNYLNEGLFAQNNVKVEWMNYDNYSEYQQLFRPFNYNVTILDLIFNEGDNATKFMKSFN